MAMGLLLVLEGLRSETNRRHTDPPTRRGRTMSGSLLACRWALHPKLAKSRRLLTNLDRRENVEAISRRRDHFAKLAMAV